MQPAADMAEQARQERHHGARHAGHLDQEAEEHEQRHRQQDEVAHALVHAADQHHQRRARGQRQIAVGRKPEPERDRHAGEHAEAGHADKEDDQVEIAERLQRAPEQPEHRDDQRDRQDRAEHDARTLPARASRSNANSAIRPMPTGSAAARQMLAICSAGVVMKLSS